MVRLWMSVFAIAVSAGAQDAQPPVPLETAKVSSGANTAFLTPVKVVSKGQFDPLRVSDEVGPIPSGKATLLGGTIQNFDPVRDRFTLQVFGGGHIAVLFDERTRVFREGQRVALDDLKNGERAYVDTVLDRTSIFAVNVRLAVQPQTGQTSGQILDVDLGNRQVTVRDVLSAKSLTMVLAEKFVILRGDKTALATDLRPGALVTLGFSPGKGGKPLVQQISILASPGDNFVFSGRIEHLDLRLGLLVLIDPRDDKSYEVNLSPADRSSNRELRQGAQIIVRASFDGKGYTAQDIVAVRPTADK